MSETNTSRIPNLIAEIKASLHELSGMEPNQMDEQASFLELGFDSLFLSQAVIRFNQKFKLELSFRQLFEDAPTIETLAEYVDGAIPKGLFAPQHVLPLTPKGNLTHQFRARLYRCKMGNQFRCSPSFPKSQRFRKTLPLCSKSSTSSCN
ncbi:MAG: acyl carrier protein [Saprospiraceae bacterium]|nr:acyl carrier protein [Saprospiraceae bacterium]